MQFNQALQHTIIWRSLNTALGFGINLLLVRIMGAALSGQFFYALALLSFITLVLSLSIETGITYIGSNTSASIPALTVGIFPLLVLQFILSWWILNWLDTQVDFLFSMLFVVGNLAVVYFSAILAALKSFAWLNSIPVVVNLIVASVLLYLWMQPNANPEWCISLFCGSFALQAFGLGIAVINLVAFKRFSFESIFVQSKKVLQYALIAFIGNVLFFLVMRVDYYFVEKYCNADTLGNYVQVSKIGQLLILLPSMIAAVIFPYSSTTTHEDEVGRVQWLSRSICWIYLPIMALIALVGYWVFPWLFGASFHQMYLPVLIYLPGFFALSIVAVIGAYLAGKALQIHNMIGSSIAIVIVAIGDYMMIPQYGIIAAALVSSIAYVTSLVYLLLVYKQKLHIGPASFFSLRWTDIKGMKALFGNQ
ncbi:MAG: hypothetical protein ACOYKE_10435 [Ferruginibacter sp.]